MQILGYRDAGRLCLWLLLGSLAMPAAAESVQAQLRWYKRVELGTPVSGVVREVKVNPGMRVDKDQLLVRLDQAVFEAQLAQAKANLSSVQEHYAEAKREENRAQELYDRTVLSDHDLQVAKNAHVRAKAQLEQAKAQLVKAQTDLQYSTLRAPFNGIVLQRLAEPGKVIAAELTPQTLVVLAEADHMLARAELSQARLQRLSVGQSVQVKLDGGQTLSGTIHTIGLEPAKADGQPPRYPVDVLFETGGALLRVGEKVELILP
jgi:RND family efflux transporter MFP subunit